MTKQDELNILDEAIAKLGEDSYLGPALAELKVFIADDIRCDFEPDIVAQIKRLETEKSMLATENKALANTNENLRESIADRQLKLDQVESNLRVASDKASDFASKLSCLSRQFAA